MITNLGDIVHRRFCSYLTPAPPTLDHPMPDASQELPQTRPGNNLKRKLDLVVLGLPKTYDTKKFAKFLKEQDVSYIKVRCHE